MIKLKEVWKTVPGWDGYYEASSLGRIRSVARIVQRGGHDMRVAERILKLNIHHSGYRRVILSRNGIRSEQLVHWIVAETFYGKRPAGLEVRHLNGDQSDNRPRNLCYGTSSENSLDTVSHGKNLKKNRSHCPLGHILAVPNLVAAELQRGHRKCRACNSARAKTHRIPALADDLQGVADGYYRKYTMERAS